LPFQVWVKGVRLRRHSRRRSRHRKNWKDRAEYDLYNAIVKEQDAGKRLALLNSWKEKYPTSDYADARLQIYVTTYAALNQPDKLSPPATRCCNPIRKT